MRTEVDRAVQVSVLGSVGVQRDGDDVELGARLRRLLAGLAVSNGLVVSTDRLVEIVWPEHPPQRAGSTLRSYVTRLRRALDADDELIVFREPGYVIDLATDELDSALFDDELDQAQQLLRTADPAGAIRLLVTAIGRWRGPAYAGFADEDWARPECVRLEARLVEAREALIEAKLASGLNEEAVAEAQALTEAEPLRDRPRSLLMRAMYAEGRQAEALRVFGTYRRYLADEAGLDPSEEIIELERRIARGDPSLSGGVRPLRGYEVKERIGEGAFSVVHRAVQPGIERDVAIKIIRAELADRPDFIRRFELEARTVARIEHPNVVPLYDYWREPGAAYLVMRLLKGGSVEQALRTSGPYSREQTVRLLDDIGGALETAHRAGVVHRDVRPANLLLDGEGTTYLADFGIALPAATIDDLPIRSPAYAAPEVLRGEPAGAAADILSLGVTTFEVLTGRLPFADTLERGDLIRRQLSDPLPPVRATRTDLPTAVDDVLARATAKAPADRYATVAAFVDDLRSALGLGTAGTRPTPVEWQGPVDNPYVGLHAFDEQDADRYFGRETLVTDLVDALERRRMVVVVGPSGSGKSSVVRAGALPAIRRGAVPGSENWFVATMVPGTDPVEAVETALLRVAVNPPATLREQLAEPGGLLRAIRRVLPDERTKILLVVDQFEELFTQARDPDERDRFLAELAEAITHPESPLRVIATLRADHYDAPLRHASVAELVTRGTVTVRPMTPGELERAISRPAAAVGVDVEPALVTDLVAGVSARPAALPLLQFSLTELFDRRVSNTMLLSTHRELGGLTGALAARADRILDAGGPDDEAEARRIFGRLVTFADAGEDTRRRALRSEFGDGERTAWILDAFVTARLLSTDRDPLTREPTVEVAHEALLREWPRAVTWLREDRDLRRTVGVIGAAADAWDRGGRQVSDLYRGGRLDSALEVADVDPEWLRSLDHEFLTASQAQADVDRSLERRRVRRLRRLVAGTAVALVIALIAGGIAFTQQRRADRAARAAEERADEATAARDEADQQRQVAEDQAVAAEAATAEAELAELVARSTAAAVDRPEQALLLALEAYRRAPGSATIGTLLDAIAGGGFGRQVGAVRRLPDGQCAFPSWQRRITSSGLTEFATVGTELVRKDLVSGEVTNRGTLPVRCADWWEDDDTGRRWVTSSTGSMSWTGSDMTRIERRDFGTAIVPEVVDGRILFFQSTSFGNGRWKDQLVVVDAENLEPIAPAVDLDVDIYELPATAASRHAGLFAVGYTSPEDPGDPEGGGLLIVLDAATGTEMFRVSRPGRVTAVAFDREGDTVLAAGDDGRVAVIDAASGEVVDELAVTEPFEVIAVGFRPDGAVVAVGPRSLELIGSDGGRREAPIDTPSADEARVRPDGSVVIVPTADPDILHVIDPDRGPLVEQGWDLADPTSLVGFGAGRAAVVEAAGSVEVIELSSGDRGIHELTTLDGEPFDAIAVTPEAEGLLAWDDGTEVARWRGGDVVEQVDLWSGRNDVTQTFRGDELRNLMIEDDGRVVRAGGGFAGAGAVVVYEHGPKAVYRFDPTPGELTLGAVLGTPPSSMTATAPAPDGGVYIVMNDRTLRRYDRSGVRVQELVTGLPGASVAVVDPATGSIALGGESGAVIVDPATGSTQSVTDVAGVVSLGFARDGSRLVIVEGDGSVRLWDTERGEPIGKLWTGSGAAPSSPPWYDESTDSVWVATSGKVLRFSLDPARWIERACELVTRELTQDEWDRLVPGDADPRPACP